MPHKIPESLVSKIRERKAHLAVIGLGYVGLPLAVEFAKVGFRVTGIDLDKGRVQSLNRGISYIPDIASEEVRVLVKEGRLKGTTAFDVLRSIDAMMICVPTPLRKTRDPDISYIVATAESIVKYIHRHQVIVLESTTYPGTTNELVLPMLEKSGLKVGTDFFLGFSPERIDPGNKIYTTTTIPKVVGGVTPACSKAIQLLYSQAIKKVIPVSSPQVAEMVKLLENTFRAVNIGLVNEIALMCHHLGVNVWEVIEAAKSKPFGFMPFYPGPGLGGHCIPIDPLYLSWKAKLLGFDPRFIDLADQINSAMPSHVVERVGLALNEKGKPVKGSRIFVLGVAYKKDVGDMRESPAIEIIERLQKHGAKVSFHDPFVPVLKEEELLLKSVPLTVPQISSADCVVIVTDHEEVDYKTVVRYARLILDTRNILARLSLRSGKVITL
ncbi:MAG: nucleotide sugar dehydrogenase [Candidatus Omnitrophica bacterium]|nr:nucleotide sugar dehydrogenase [Candidatus Omnitrophota bacterium]